MADKKVMKVGSTQPEFQRPEESSPDQEPADEKHIRDLLDRIRAAHDPDEVKRLGDELYEFMFGSANARN